MAPRFERLQNRRDLGLQRIGVGRRSHNSEISGHIAPRNEATANAEQKNAGFLGETGFILLIWRAKSHKLKSVTPLQYLSQSDPILAAVIERVGPLPEPCPIPGAHFSALCHIVVGQQLSVAVARAIWKRIEAHFGDGLSPDAVLQTSAEELRTLGLSAAKARTLGAIATHINEGNLKIGALESLSDEEIAREIVAVKGLGPWSADMFLMFHLVREDVLPVGDLGIKEAMRRLYNLEARPDAAKMHEIAAPWRPHRTLASRYLWRALDTPQN